MGHGLYQSFHAIKFSGCRSLWPGDCDAAAQPAGCSPAQSTRSTSVVVLPGLQEAPEQRWKAHSGQRFACPIVPDLFPTSQPTAQPFRPRRGDMARSIPGMLKVQLERATDFSFEHGAPRWAHSKTLWTKPAFETRRVWGWRIGVEPTRYHAEFSFDFSFQ